MVAADQFSTMVTTEEKQVIVSALLQRIRVTEEESEMKACATAIRILLRETDATEAALTEEVCNWCTNV
jgi:hypothetical protein